MFSLRISDCTINKFSDFVNATAQSNALIVSGPSGIGKQYIIELFLKQRLSITHLVHHNLLWLDAFPSGIPVEEIRNIHNFIYKTSYDNKTKFVVINAVDKLNVFAYNSLLKILEEPTKGTIFILISSHYKLLPATIKSRCIKLKFTPSSKEDSYKIIKDHHPDLSDIEITQYCYLANYASFRALDFIKAGYLDFYKDFVVLLMDFFKTPQDSFQKIDKIVSVIDLRFICYALNHIMSKCILSVATYEESDITINGENDLIKQILFLHPSKAELLLLEQEVSYLTAALTKFSLNKNNIVLMIIYKLMYR